MDGVNSTEFEAGRRELGEILRKHRKARGLTGMALVRILGDGFSQPKLSKLETGRVLAAPADVRRIVEALEVPDSEAKWALALSETLAREVSSWRLVHRRGLRFKQEEVLTEEAASKRLRFYQATLIPGPIQIPEYARHVLTQADHSSTGDVEEAAAVRVMERQRLVFEGTRRYEFLIEEEVLYRRHCPVEVLLIQLDFLRSVAELPNVGLWIIPRDAERPSLVYNSFVLYDDRVAVSELNLDEPKTAATHDLEKLALTYERLRAVSADGDDALALVDRAKRSHATTSRGIEASQDPAHPPLATGGTPGVAAPGNVAPLRPRVPLAEPADGSTQGPTVDDPPALHHCVPPASLRLGITWSSGDSPDMGSTILLLR